MPARPSGRHPAAYRETFQQPTFSATESLWALPGVTGLKLWRGRGCLHKLFPSEDAMLRTAASSHLHGTGASPRSGRRQAGSRLGRDALHMLIMCWTERAGHAPSEAQTIVVRKWSRRPGKKTRVVVSQQVCMNLPNTAHERLPDFLTDLLGVLLSKNIPVLRCPALVSAAAMQ